MLELVGFVFRFEDFLVLCCDCVQHNVLCNESEFSTVCVIQTVGSLVTRQGLNCFFCVSIPENNFWHFVYIYKCQAIMFLAQISLCFLYSFVIILGHPTLAQMIIHFLVVPLCLSVKHCE